LELAFSVLIGLFGGQWLDEKFETRGLLTFLGIALGLTAGYRSLWQHLQRANRAADDEEKRERERREKYHDEEK
jgi:F0F1-type ATP synthase assembly protein I